MSAGSDAADEVHQYVAEVIEEVGIDTSGQDPKILRTYTATAGPAGRPRAWRACGTRLRGVQRPSGCGVSLSETKRDFSQKPERLKVAGLKNRRAAAR
jgi:hypothetical protein